MASFRGNIFRSVISKKYNLSTKSHTNSIAAIKSMEKALIHRRKRNSKSLFLEKKVTKDGTRYELAKAPDQTEAPENRRLVVYFHGGAYIWELSDFYRSLTNDFSQAGNNADVIFLDYSTAPEYIYPTQHNQALNLWEEITTVLNYDPENIIIGGDSAGANLMLSFMLKLRDLNQILPRAAFSISLWGDMTASGESYIYNYHNDVMFGYPKGTFTDVERQEMITSGIYSFVGEEDPLNPYISPVFGDYHGFPPMLFTAGADEMLLSDTLRVMKNFNINGIPVQLFSAPQMFHIYPLFRSYFYEAETDYNRILHFISQKFQEPVFIPTPKKF